MAPMAVLEIGGLAPDSRAYKELAARLEKQTGLTARPASSAGFWAGADAPALQAGSAVLELFSLGSVWYGAAGTVTYVNDGVAMSFGHDVWWTGDCGAAMVAGSVSGIWPSDWDPFVMIDPRDIKGTFVQDRTWGAAGVVDLDPDMIPITTHVTLPENGRDIAGESAAVQWAFQTPGYEELPAFPVMYALWRACDVSYMPGSAETTTTVKAHDATGAYTVTIDNLWDSYDITFDPFFDVDSAVYTLGQDPDGVLDVHLDSIDFEAVVSSARRSARPVAIVLPAGELHTGDNEVEVTYYGYGSAALQTMSATLTIPDGTPVNGDIAVMPGGFFWGGDEMSLQQVADDAAPLTLADLVDSLNGQSKNSDLLLTFYPRATDGGAMPVGSQEGGSAKDGDPYGGSDLDPITVTVPTDWVFQDALQASTAQVTLDAEPARVDRGEPVMLTGTVQGIGAGVPVEIYRIDAATGTPALVDTVTTTVQEGTSLLRGRGAAHTPRHGVRRPRRSDRRLAARYRQRHRPGAGGSPPDGGGERPARRADGEGGAGGRRRYHRLPALRRRPLADGDDARRVGGRPGRVHVEGARRRHLPLAGEVPRQRRERARPVADGQGAGALTGAPASTPTT